MKQLLWLIPVLPLIGFLVNGFLRPARTVAAIVGCAGPIASFGLSIAAFAESRRAGGEVVQQVFDWITVGNFSIPFGLTVDPLAGVMILVVTGVGSLIHIYSVSYMHDDPGFSRFFAYLNLFMFSMLILVLGDSILLMFVGWEGVGLCSYLLIGFWYKDLKNADAGQKAFITNRIGDFGFILGIFCLWQMYQSLDFGTMASRTVSSEGWATAAGLLLFLGATGKSAQIPLYVWLPDAMAGPTPVSALIHAATMVTAGVYMMARMNFLYVAVPGVLAVVVLIAAATAFMAGVIAVAQHDIKKVLAYSTVSQLGFMFAGIGAADFTAGMFHVVTHAFFKALLFLGAGAAIHALHGEQDLRKMAGLGKRLPALAAVFTAGGLALAGLPLSSGFFSKESILIAVYLRAEAGSASHMLAWVLLVLTAGLTAFYTARLVLLAFFTPGHHEEGHEVHAPGALMMGPLWILAFFSLAGGYLLHTRLPDLFTFPVSATPAVDYNAAGRINLLASIAMFVGGAGVGLLLYGRASGRDWVRRFVEGGGRAAHRLVARKFYVDEIYEFLVIAPVKMGATVAWFVVDRILIDTVLVHGTGRLMYVASSVFRRGHTGTINMAAITFVVGVVAALAYFTVKFLIAWKSPS